MDKKACKRHAQWNTAKLRFKHFVSLNIKKELFFVQWFIYIHMQPVLRQCKISGKKIQTIHTKKNFKKCISDELILLSFEQICWEFFLKIVRSHDKGFYFTGWCTYFFLLLLRCVCSFHRTFSFTLTYATQWVIFGKNHLYGTARLLTWNLKLECVFCILNASNASKPDEQSSIDCNFCVVHAFWTVLFKWHDEWKMKWE